MNSTLLKVLAGEKVTYPPMWLMRQAGRYLPEYQQVRAQAGSFLNLCHNPKLAAAVTLQPLARFDLDAAIIFSDILVVLQALGLNLDFVNQVGPVISNPIRDIKDVMNLDLDNVKSLGYVAEAINLVAQKLDSTKALIGFAGSPWTVATYAVEGQSSKTFSQIKQMLYANSDCLNKLLEILTQATIAYLKSQIEAGAEVLMLFDSWAGVLPQHIYLQYSLKYLEQIVIAIQAYNPHIPVIIFSKNGGKYLDEIINTGCAGVGLDATANLAAASSQAKNKVALQGNLEPAALFAPKPKLEQEIIRVLESVGSDTRYIFNLGHGVLPQTPISNVEFLVETVKNYKNK